MAAFKVADDQHDEPARPYQVLANAVLRQAVFDRDWAWLLGDSPSLQLWCAAADMNIDTVRRMARQCRDERQPAWLTAMQERWQALHGMDAA